MSGNSYQRRKHRRTIVHRRQVVMVSMARAFGKLGTEAAKLAYMTRKAKESLVRFQQAMKGE